MAVGRVHVRLFATARTALRRSSISVEVPADGVPAQALIARLAREHPALAPVLGSCRFARNDAALPNLRARLRPGDELAVHPPYGGG